MFAFLANVFKLIELLCFHFNCFNGEKNYNFPADWNAVRVNNVSQSYRIMDRKYRLWHLQINSTACPSPHSLMLDMRLSLEIVYFEHKHDMCNLDVS